MVTINGKAVRIREEAELVEYLLREFPEAHNGDSNVDSNEAMRLLDADKSGYIGISDLNEMLCLGAEKFLKGFSVFRNFGIQLRVDASFINDEKTLMLRFAEKYPDDIFYNISCLVDKPYAEDVIKKAAEKSPRLAIHYSSGYQRKSFFSKIIDMATELDPESVFEYASNSTRLMTVLEKSSKISSRTIIKIIKSHYTVSERIKLSILTNEIAKGRMTLEQAHAVSKDDKKFFETLLSIKSEPNHIGRKAVDRALRDISLRIVEKINDLHERPATVRFKSIEGLSSDKLYTLIVYSEEEIFTSSFNGIFYRFILAMKKENISGDELLKKLGYNKLRIFIRLCSSFNRLNDFLSTMSLEKKKELLKNFVSGLDKIPNVLSEAAAIADTFGIIADANIIKILQESVRKEYGRVLFERNKEAVTLYGLLASLLAKKTGTTDVWDETISRMYKFPELIKISQSELFDSEGRNIQQHFFYDDQDGRNSFANFLSQYKNDRSWTIEQHGTYVVVKSVKLNGKQILMFANLPTKLGVEDGVDDIGKFFEDKKMHATTKVHHGHSYHAQKTIERITPETKLVMLGSCGGYSNISSVLAMAPDAHIISTKSTGMMRVNDPLCKMLNEEMLKGDISWPVFWLKAERRFSKIREFSSYISPHKNLGVTFLKAYFSLTKN